MAGVTVVTRPPLLTGGDDFDTDTLIGTGLGLAAMVAAIGVVLVLRIVRNVHFTTVSIVVGIVGILMCIALSAAVTGFSNETVIGPLPFQLPEGKDDWLKAGAMAGATFLQQIALTLALKYEEAGLVSLVETSSILFSYLWQFIFLGMAPDIYSVVGGIVVIGGVVVAGIRKIISELPDNSRVKQKFWLLLK